MSGATNRASSESRNCRAPAGGDLAIITHRVTHGDGQGRVNLAAATAALDRFARVWLIAAEVDPDLRAHPRVHWLRATHGPLPGALLRNAWFAATTARLARRHLPPATVVLANGAVTWRRADANAVHFVHTGWRSSPWYQAGRGFAGAYQRFYTRYNAWAERRALARARVVIAVSPRVADELGTVGVCADRIEVIVNGVDAAMFRPADPADGARRVALGLGARLPAEAPLALFAGDIVTGRKNLGTVLHALTLVPELHLAVVGATPRSPFPALAEQLGLASRVHFLGFRRDMPEVMRAADLFVFPSRYDPFGLVVLEAMASGLPVVTARTCGAAALIGPDAGIVIDDPDDRDALAEALTRLAGDEFGRRTMGAAARTIAVAHDWTTCGARYADVLAGLATADARAAA